MLGKTESHWRQHGLDHFSHLPHALSRLEKETKGTLVLITGTLQRHGHEAACSVVARKHASTHGPIYTDCCVLQAPGSLDDGVYTLTFRGYSALTEKASGLWLSVDEFKVE